MTRKERWIGLIDRNLDYLFRNQRPEGSIGEDRSRSTVQMAHAAAWAFLTPKSKYFRKQEAAERAQRAMDFLAQNVDGWERCPFTPSYFGEALLLMEKIGGKEKSLWREALLTVLNLQRKTGGHTYGHFSDWDVLYALSLALGGKIFGDEQMKKAAAEHAQLVRPNVVPGGDGFYYLISPYQYWSPSVNYTGITTATFARYYEISGDCQALEMIRGVKDYFLTYTEPSGLTEFAVSPWHKHTVDTKQDTFAFVAAAAEFLARVTEDRRQNQVAELMLQNLESMVTPEGDFRNKPWKPALTNSGWGFDPNATGYLLYAADWCDDGMAEALPDNYISEQEGIHTFKARFGDFGYSVTGGEGHVSLCAAWVGRDSLLEEVAPLVADKDGLVFGQVCPLWRKQVTNFPQGFVQTTYYQPGEIIGDSWKSRYAQWMFYQTYVGTGEELVGFISLESLVEQQGRYAAVDFHLGPAGEQVSFGAKDIQGQAPVSTENPQPILLADLTGDSWVHYGRLGIFLQEISGKGMSAACWDGMAKSRLFHDAGEGAGDGLSSVISNDLVISCSTPERLQPFQQGARYQVVFVTAPAENEHQALCIARSGRYTILPTGVEHTFCLAIDQQSRILLVLVSHQPMVSPVLLRHSVPQGSYQVRVYGEERQLVLKEFSFSGRELQIEVATVSPAVVVELVKR